MKRKKFKLEKYVDYNKLKKKSTCLIETCKRELAGKSPANIRRHYKLVHRQDIVNSGDEFEEFDNDSNTDVVYSTNKEKDQERAPSELIAPLSRDDFIKCCVGLVTIQNIPLRIFDDETFFKKLIAPYEQKFYFNLNSNNISATVDKASRQIKAEIAALVKNKILCLKIDIANRIGNSVLGINIQFINDYRVQTHTIGMIQTNQVHTAESLKDEILNCLFEYNISIDQIYSITSDNGANVVNLSKQLKDVQPVAFIKEEPDIDITESNQIASKSLIYEKDDVDVVESDQIEQQLSIAFPIVRCVAHTVQLAASDVIKTFKKDIDDCRKLTKELRTAARANSNGLTFPSIDCLFSWKSTYNMMDTILCLKGYIANNFKTKNIFVNWISVQNFITAFQPLTKCSLKLQDEQYILGDFFRDWLACELELCDLVNNNPYAEALCSAMKIRKEELMRHDAFVAALYLDPRFNFELTPLLSEEEKQVAIDHIMKTHDLITKYDDSPNTLNKSNTFTESSSFSTNDDLPGTSSMTAYDKLTQHVQSLRNLQKTPTQNPKISLKRKIMKLSEGAMAPFNTNVLDFWQKLYDHDVEMTRLAEVILAVPPTQVSVERAFGALSTIMTNLCSKLSQKSLSNLLIAKLNFEFLDFSTTDLEDPLTTEESKEFLIHFM